MPCPTGSFKIISRGKGQSCMASCAYYSGEKKYSEYECCWKYPHSSPARVKWVEVMLPSNAPRAYADPQTLWNAVDAAETSVNAQTALSMLFALPRELTDEQNLALVRDFCQKEFVDKGMVCNFFYHDKGDGNPHVHIMLTLRAMDENGKWLPKSKNVYALDENGNRIRTPNGSWKRVKVNTSTPSACSENGMYAYPYSNYVFLRDVGIEGEAKQTVLTLMGNVSSKTIIDFTIQNPDIAVVTTESMNPNELIQAAVSGDSGVDLFVLSAPGDFYSMKEKGYISALNTSEKLIGEARKLYPAMQDVVFSGDSLLGYPVSVSPKSWMVNETKWNEMNLGDYPKTYNELFEKIEMWLNEYAADYPEYTLADVQQMGLNTLVLSMVEAYIHENEASGMQLTFDTPSFREMMKCVSDNAYLLSEENEQWGMPLLTSMYLGFGTCYTDSDLNRMILPPALDLNGKQSLYAEMSILAVNAASKNAEVATRFMEFCAENLSNTVRYEMEPALNEPVESSAYYVRVAELQGKINDLAEQLEKADQDARYAIKEKIIQAEAKLEQLEERKWEIDPKSIEIYRSAAENLKVSYKSPLLLKGENGGYEALRSVVDKYCTQDFSDSDINALIVELDRVATMVYLESL